MSSPFSDRLRRVCDTSQREEFRTYGRQALIARAMDVSEETVRKWFSGLMMPRPDKLKKLANFLDVDEVWLALGKDADVDARQQKTLSRNVDGAVLFVRGMLQLAGGVTADPGPKDRSAPFVDFYVIVGGQQVAVHVAYGRETDEGFLIPVPAEYDQVRVLAVVPYRANYLVLDLPSDKISKHRFRKAGNYAVLVERAEGGGFVTDGDEWPRLRPGTLPAL